VNPCPSVAKFVFFGFGSKPSSSSFHEIRRSEDSSRRRSICRSMFLRLRVLQHSIRKAREIRRVSRRPPARSKASPWLESRMWGKMASCCRLVIGLYESSSPFMGLKGRLHGRKTRSSRSPGLRLGRQFAHQRNCGRAAPWRGFHPLSWAEGPCGQALPHRAVMDAFILTSRPRRGRF
jgi:hypothetical protein